MLTTSTDPHDCLSFDGTWPGVMEFGTDGLGVGVVDFVENGQSVLPGVLAGRGIADGVVGVADVGEDGCFAVAFADVPEQVNGVLEAGDGLGVVAQMVVSVADAVPGVG